VDSSSTAEVTNTCTYQACAGSFVRSRKCISSYPPPSYHGA
jgi:hypothetical protein